MKRRGALRETVQTILVALILALLVRTFVVEPFVVKGYSMQPTLQNGERLLVDKFLFHVKGLKDGEIVVFHPPIPKTTEDYIKRVIATGGQTVSMKQGQVYVNGKAINQSFLHYGQGQTTQDTWTMSPKTVPAGDIFVLGDNRAHSEDSRYFGMVPLKSVKGVAFFVLWPLKWFGAVPVP